MQTQVPPRPQWRCVQGNYTRARLHARRRLTARFEIYVSVNGAQLSPSHPRTRPRPDRAQPNPSEPLASAGCRTVRWRSRGAGTRPSLWDRRGWRPRLRWGVGPARLIRRVARDLTSVIGRRLHCESRVTQVRMASRALLNAPSAASNAFSLSTGISWRGTASSVAEIDGGGGHMSISFF